MKNQYYQATLETPLGPMLAIADDTALCLLEFFDRKNIERQIRRMTISKISDKRSASIKSIQTELDLYFSGKLKQFNTPICFTGTDFQKRVWRQLQNIPFGQTRSYLEIANKIGQPSATRALANANAANMLAIVVPCHRVINANGQLGGYAGGLDRKTFLIEHENK